MKKLLAILFLILTVSACGGGGGGDTGGTGGTGSGITLISLDVTPASAILAVGGTQQLTVTGSYSDGSTADITNQIDWSVFSSSIAAVANGQITATASGSEVFVVNTGGVSVSFSLTVTGNVTSDLFGKWVYIDTAEEIELLSSTVLPSYTKLSSNILKTGTRHLLRASVANTAVNGKVLGDATSKSAHKPGQKAFAGIGGIGVILTNINDSSVTATATTSVDGSFADNSLPSGVYAISGNDGNGGTFNSSVSITGATADLGNFSLDNNGYNFKTELILNQEFAYADGTTYSGVVRMHNTGTNEGTGLAYDVTMVDPYLNSFNPTITLGTVPAGTYKDIPVTFSFNALKTSKRIVTINTDIRDVYGNVWTDSFDITVYRRSMPINLTADVSTVKGYVIIAGNKLIPFNTTNSTINVPVDPATEMFVVLSNADIATETAYSIGIDTPSISTADFNNPIAFEPNNDEAVATTMALGAAEVAYLHVGDLDYFAIDQSSEQVALNANLNETISGADLNTTYRSTTLSAAEFLYEGETISVTVTGGNLVLNGVVQAVSTAIVGFSDTVAVELTSARDYQAQVIAHLAAGAYAQQYTVNNKTFTKNVAGLSVNNTDLNREYTVDVSSVLDLNDSVDLCVSSGSLVVDYVDTLSLCQAVTGTNTVGVKTVSSVNYGEVTTNTVSLGGVSFDYTLTNKNFTKSTAGFAQSGLNLNSVYVTDISSVLDLSDSANLCVTNATLVVDTVDTAVSCQNVTGDNFVEVKMTTAPNFSAHVINTVSLGGASFDITMTTRSFSYNTTALNSVDLKTSSSHLVDVSSYIDSGETTEVCTSTGTVYVNSANSGQLCQTVTGDDLVEVGVSSSVNYNEQLTVSITVGGNVFDVTYQTRAADIVATPSVIAMVANDAAISTMSSEQVGSIYSTNSSTSFVGVAGDTVNFTPVYADVGSYIETIDSSYNGVAQNSTDIYIDVHAALLNSNSVSAGGSLAMKVAVPTTTDNVKGIRVGDVDQVDGKLLWNESLSQRTVVNNANISLTYNGKVYILNEGGVVAYSTTLDVYDPVTDQWTITSMPFNYSYGYSFVEAGGKLYVLGGKSNTVYEIDPVSYAVSTYSAAMTYFWDGSTAIVIGTKIYLAGGTAYTSADDFSASSAEADIEAFDTVSKTATVPASQVAGSAALWSGYVSNIGTDIYLVNETNTSVYKYDTVNDNMTPVASRLGASLYEATLIVMGGKAYLYGGGDSCMSCSGRVNYNTMQVYDPVANQWTLKANMLSARDGDQAVVINNKLYTFGIETTASYPNTYASSRAEVYDPVLNTWSSLTASTTPVRFGEAGLINGKLYIVSGTGMQWNAACSCYDSYQHRGVIGMERYLENDTSSWLSNGLYQIDFTNIDATTKKLGYTRGGVVIETFDITVQ
ncbi:MAG: Ig-like domain-containing protein [Gammaproteobacteria bacterium]|nr:Ig-like domain-containing protein [Gammaproteobacteria bacterium]